MQTRKRLVVFFHPVFSDGGVERTNIYLAKGLIDAGYRVEFLTTIATNHFRHEVSDAGIKMVELGNIRTLLSVSKIRKHLLTTSSKYERVYFISCQYYVNVISMFVSMLLFGRLKNVKFINSERNHFNEFSINGGFKNKVVFFLVRYLYRFSHLVIANSHETANDLSQIIGKEVHCVYNPTINDRINILKEELINEDWFLKDSRPCVIGIGRFSHQKDFETLIKAFRLVRNHVNAKLVILGEGELRNELEHRKGVMGLESDVYLPGFVANPYKFIASSDVFVLSSMYEGLPNVLIEAVYLGIPCVSTNCKSGPREILLEGKGGRLVPVADEIEMANAIISTLSNPNESKNKSELALSKVTRFRYDRVQKNFENVINL